MSGTASGIPDYQTLMLPLLRLAGDGGELVIGQVIDRLARELGLSDEQRADMLPSGRQRRLDNRVHWARSYLAQAGPLGNAGRGRFRITALGRQMLALPLRALVGAATTSAASGADPARGRHL